MKLHRLELTGFGPFRQTQEVDFDGFDADGIFLISGRTGAGKSSVLDGVCFALYGNVPRYDGSDRRLRSDHCAPEDPTEVRLEFTVGGSRWRVVRAPEYARPKLRGDGMTVETARAELYEFVDDGWVGRAGKPRDVAEVLDGVLGLNLQQFQQVILLAQNKFSRFLLAKNDERQALLRTLFGTRRYEDYARALDERRKTVQQLVRERGVGAEGLLGEAERLVAEHDLRAEAPAPGAVSAGRESSGGEVHDTGGAGRAGGGVLADAGASGGGPDGRGAPGADSGAPGADRGASEGPGGDLGPAAGDFRTRLDAALVAVQRAEYRVESRAQERIAAEAAADAATAEHARLSALRATQVARDAAAARLTDLEAVAAGIAADRTRIERAAAAEALRAPLDAAARANAALAEASTEEERAGRVWADGGDDPTADLDALDDEITGDLGRWQAAQEAERELTAAEAEHDSLRGRVAAGETALADLDARRAAAPVELAALGRELDRVQGAAGALDALRATRDGVHERLEAARAADLLAPRAAAADVAYAAALDASAQAGSALTTLLQRRLAGHAGELAAALVEGEPCAVCGATVHPHPAAVVDDPVTDDMIAVAESIREEAVAAERRAGDDARTLRAEHAVLAARAGGDGAEVLEAQATAADASVAEAESAERERAELSARRAALVELDESAAREREGLVAELAETRESAARVAATVEALRATVAAARGAHGSVADRVREATERRRRARALRDAQRARASTEAAAIAAERDLAERVAASDFADESDAAGSLLTAAEVQRLRERVQSHERDLAVVRARLLELQLELAGTPDEPVDVDLAESARTEADTARSRAIAALSVAQTTAERLRDLVERTDAAYAELARLDDDAAVVTRLADTLQGRAPNTKRMTLETFVLAAELEEIVAAANVRLEEMSSGRYTLHHTDSLAARGAASGLGIEVRDAHTGRSRPPQSLSGGETFLASLALALGLAEVVTNRAGGIRLDTLFVDEGFGSLDAETLEFAMRALDELRAGGRTVGVISHVEAMKEQLPAQLLVEATPQGPSTIRRP